MLLKRIALITALLSLALTGVAHADTFTVDGLTADIYGQPTQGRVFMFHAMNGTRAHDGNQGQVIDGLVDLGYQVIAPDEPLDGPGQSDRLRQAFQSDGTSGQTYRDQWATITHDFITETERRYGTVPRLLMAGQSWGGFSAMLAACSNPETDGFLVTIPVVDPNSYAPFAQVDLRNLQLTTQGCDTRLAAMPGLVVWGAADQTVGTAATDSLVAELGSSVTGCEYRLLDHEDSPLAYSNMVRWVNGARDCLPWPAQAPVSGPVVASQAPAAAPAPAPTNVASKPVSVRRAVCNRSNHCRTMVRRGKVYRVYTRHGHQRWVYVRKARHTLAP